MLEIENWVEPISFVKVTNFRFPVSRAAHEQAEEENSISLYKASPSSQKSSKLECIWSLINRSKFNDPKYDRHQKREWLIGKNPFIHVQVMNIHNIACEINKPFNQKQENKDRLNSKYDLHWFLICKPNTNNDQTTVKHN